MPWYRIKIFNEYSVLPDQFVEDYGLSGNLINTPVYNSTDGRWYGTKNNPMTGLKLRGNTRDGKGYRDIISYYTRSTSNLIAVMGFYQGRTAHSDINYQKRSGFPFVFNSDNTLTENIALEKLTEYTISGKYKFKPIHTPTAGIFESYNVDFSINGIAYNFISFNKSKLPFSQYDEGYGWDISERYFDIDAYRFTITQYNGDIVGLWTLKDGVSEPTPTYITDNWSAYAGEIIDFGATPQSIPSTFKDWVDANLDPIYPYTFTVKSQNGVNTLASLEESPAMVDASVSAVGNVKTLTMTGVNGRTYTMTWESETPEGKQFLGLAYGANETRASIPPGRTTPVTWDGSLTIYEVYGTYRPPVTTFDINLYQSSAEVNRVDKTNYLTGVGTLSGVLREECSIIAPSITFKQTTVPSFNYVYIAAFGRYYYVTGITSVSKGIWRMSLSCDVLMTWKDDIRALTAIIARQENSFNPLLLDSELPAQANQNITVIEFPAGGFSTDSAIAYPFILTVVGA